MYVGEEDIKFFEEFVVSKEDLQLAEASGVAEQDSNRSKHSHTVSFDSPSASITQLGLQLQRNPALCEQAPDHSSPGLYQQVLNDGAAPPLSPSIDGSDNSPTASSSVTFAGMSTYADVCHVHCMYRLAQHSTA